MAKLCLNNVSKQFGKTVVVNQVSFDVEEREFLVMLGPSGCGKSTILRMIAGLEKVTSGEIVLDGDIINQIPPQQRDMAMVFQNYALYAHLKIYDNLAFGLRMRKTPKDEIDNRVKNVGEMLGIGKHMEKYPRQLSGGERQRVALGRAIVREPKLFLMDEPLSNLDALLRIQTRVEILQLYKRIGATVIYVTHDQVEAMTMGQRIVLLREGVVHQIDTPEGIYNQPADRFVGRFVGSPPMNSLDNMELDFINGSLWAKSSSLSLDLSGYKFENRLKEKPELINRSVTIGFRPDAACINPSEESGQGGIPATIEIVEVIGREALVYCKIGKELICLSVPPEMAPILGENVVIQLQNEKVHIFDSRSEKNLSLLI
jgi:multiple sugar transport system ATP-binding protein